MPKNLHRWLWILISLFFFCVPESNDDDWEQEFDIDDTVVDTV